MQLGGKIDKALQSMNEGQTHGIPIGPDTSFLAAEILLAAVDAELINRLPGAIRGLRYIDDYELCFKSLGEGEAALTELQAILSDFELRLNPRKTRLQDLPLSLEETWAVDLGRFIVRDASSPVGQRNDLTAFFSWVAEMAQARPEEAVVRYALAKIQNLKVAPSGWKTFQNCVLGAANSEASSLSIAFGTLFRAAQAGGHAIAKGPL